MSILAVALDRPITPERIVIFADMLLELPEASVFSGLRKLQRNWRGMTYPSLPDIFDAAGVAAGNGRPGPEEAWARMPKRENLEADTIVWCEEERAAYACCRSLLIDGDVIAARMAFLEAYKRELAKAEETPVQWYVSAGYDVTDRILKLSEAVKHERLSLAAAKHFVPLEREPEFARLLPPAQAKGLLLAAPKSYEEITRELPALTGVLHKIPDVPLPEEISLEIPGLAGVLHKMDVDGTLPGEYRKPKLALPDRPLTAEERREKAAQQSAALRALEERRLGRVISDDEWRQMKVASSKAVLEKRPNEAVAEVAEQSSTG